MIKILISKDKNSLINGISLDGHSGYAESGYDIVCSAVSTSMYLTVNLLEKLKIKYQFEEDSKVPYMSLHIESVDEEQSKLVQVIMENLVENLEMISKEYQKFLKITK